MKPITSKTDLYNAYRGIVNTKLVSYQVIKGLVAESKTFLIGDGRERKIQIRSIDPSVQSSINKKLETSNFYSELDAALTDAFVYEGYIDYSNTKKLRALRGDDVTQVYYDPENKYNIVYLRENREVWDAGSNSYRQVEVEHYLEQPESNSALDLLDLKDHKYIRKIDGIVEETDLSYIPIVRLVTDLDGIDAVSFVEPLIVGQLEYNDIRSRIHEYNKSHRPQMYSIGSSMPKVIGRTNKAKPQPIDTPAGEAIYQTSYNEGEPSIIHLDISKHARDNGIQPRLGYAQPVDSNMLERQITTLDRDLYKMTGVPSVLELENARSASSSSSLAVLYEPLLRKTRKRAEYIISAINIIMDALRISDYEIVLPNMMPKNIEAEKLELEKVKNKVISRKSFLMQNGYSKDQAELEIQNLKDERILAVQFSGVITDSQDAPNTDNNAILDTLDEGTTIQTPIEENVSNG
jgi:hypothetical protein